jgi:hypothetical protein
MLYDFPIPCADELFYSLIARHADRRNYPNPTAVLEELFGTATLTATVDFPSRLRRFMGTLVPGHPCSTSKLLSDHTFFPWYAPFLPRERVDQIRGALLESGGSTVLSRVGIIAGRVPVPRFLRFCPACLQDDINSSIEPYWRRLHQLAGIEICPMHRIFFENSPVLRVKKVKRTHFEVLSETFLKINPRHADESAEPLIRLARLGQELLSMDWPTLGLKNLRSHYFRLLKQSGYTSRSGTPRVCIRRLDRDLRAFYPTDLLSRLGCNTDHWLIHLVRSSDSIQAPIRHLLLLCFLGTNLQEFFGNDNSHPAKKTDKANITCENLVCPQKGTQSAAFVREEYSSPLRGFVESYRCESCGQTRLVCRAGRERSWVREYGFLWKEKLRQLWNTPSNGFRNMICILGHSADTIKSQAIKARLQIPRPGQKRTSVSRFKHLFKLKQDARTGMLTDLRARWLSLRGEFPKATVTGLRAQGGSIYASLYRYDRQWLLAHQPGSQRWWPKGKPRVDWRKRDDEMCQKILNAISNLRDKFKPGKRLTVSAVARAVGLNAWLTDQLKKLPKSRSALIKGLD